MGGGAWWATVHGVAKSRTRLSNFTSTVILSVYQYLLQVHRRFRFSINKKLVMAVLFTSVN